MLFTIQLVNLFFMIILNYKNLKFKHLIGNIVIDFDIFKNFANMGIKYELTISLKFIYNKKKPFPFS